MNTASTPETKAKLFTLKTGLLTFVAVACSIGIMVVAFYPENKKDAATQTASSSQAEQVEESNNDSETPADQKTPTETEIRSMDVEVKNAMASAGGAVSEFVNNNNGRMPATADDFAFINQMLSDNPKHPVTGQAFVLVQTEPKDHELYYAVSKQCADDDSTFVDAASKRRVIIQARLVSGPLHCLDV